MRHRALAAVALVATGCFDLATPGSQYGKDDLALVAADGARGADGAAAVDLAVADGRLSRDQAAADLTAPDLFLSDLATPDLATPATPDLATPATPDLATPDSATPDLATPDLATPDLATLDSAGAPDAATQADQSVPPLADLSIASDAAPPNQCDGAATTITGTAFAATPPLYGAPDPLYQAFVYVPNGQVMPFTSGVSCDTCGSQISGSPLVSATTGVDGRFTLTNAPCGVNISLVIQLGRWRRMITIPKVACCQTTTLTPDQTRLPRMQAEFSQYDNIPLIAMVTGDNDNPECLLRKIGIADSQFTTPLAAGRVQIYVGNGADVAVGFAPSESTLWGNQIALNGYDMVIAGCQGTQNIRAPTDQQRVVSFTSSGGRLFLMHLGYEWLSNVAPFMGTAQWNLNQAPTVSLTATVDQSVVKGVAFAQWLQLTGASTIFGQVPVIEARHDFDAVIPPAQRWLYSVMPAQPLQYSFDTPVGAQPGNQCGRVLFSDFHVTNSGGNGALRFPTECNSNVMTPHEKALEFMLFDLASCL